jgi:hypothetical protein
MRADLRRRIVCLRELETQKASVRLEKAVTARRQHETISERIDAILMAISELRGTQAMLPLLSNSQLRVRLLRAKNELSGALARSIEAEAHERDRLKAAQASRDATLTWVEVAAREEAELVASRFEALRGRHRSGPTG